MIRCSRIAFAGSLVLFLAPLRLISQRAFVMSDSLEQRLMAEVDDRVAAEICFTLALSYADQLKDSLAMARLIKGCELANRIGYPVGTAYAHLIPGMAQHRTGRYAEALDEFHRCIDILDSLGVKQGLIAPLGFIRQLYNDAGLQEEKLVYYEAKLAYYQQHGPIENSGACHHGIGGFYYSTGQADMAIEHYLRAREYFASFDPTGYANQLLPVSTLYMRWGNIEKAEKLRRQAIAENERVGNIGNLFFGHFGMAEILLAKGDTAGAVRELERVQHYAPYATPQLLAPSLLAMVNIRIAQHQMDDAARYLSKVDSLASVAFLPLSSVKGEIELDYWRYRYYQAQGNYDAADAALDRALATAHEQHLPSLIQKYRKELAHRDRVKGAVTAALDTLVAYLQIEDSLNAMADRQRVADYERDVSDRQRTEQMRDKDVQLRQQRVVVYAAGAIVMLLAALVLIVVRNNRQKQRANRELNAARQRAEASEKFKQQFLANMSHEIRTPMNAIMGMSGILKRNEHTPEQEKYLNAISQSSENLLVILNDILDLSKLEAGKIDLEQVAFDPRAIIGNVRDILRFKAEEKGLALEVRIADDVPSSLLGDPTRLNQILLNLAGNAIKFTEHGSVTMHVRWIDGSGLTIDVIDTGIGIPADRLDKIFEEFTQAYSDTTRKYGGTGLGLTISKRLAEMQGGSIVVKSEQGEGSTFTVTIPYAISKDAEVPDGREISRPDRSLRDLRILLAEDNDFNVMVAQDELADAIPGVQVDVAANGTIAVKMAQARDYDVILMDVQMPEMNGYDATRAIRDLPSDKSHVPILAMTANVMKEELERCKEAGMNGHIPKPFKREELMRAIGSVLKVGYATRNSA
ncbi:MAG: response regulator [Flavobacteriales bacterium]|nr:response regulator [Flavobacteriales bacterium]